ncbi:MAG: hypothetical protein HY359_07815 [Candidatus Rokubacteria bacterium]|nr:hypothetical protein [Candidatus Rokubacteria bacterium]
MATGDNFILGLPNNAASNPTELTATPPFGLAGLQVRNGFGDAVVGDASGAAGIADVSVKKRDGIGVIGIGPRAGMLGSAGGAAGGVGVFGDGPVAGMVGQSISFPGVGVQGQTISGVGVKGVSIGPVGAAVAAVAQGGAHALVASANTFPGLAGVFFGHVSVIGSFGVFGGPKSAAVPFRDGSHRLLYSMESPESWFEDFGTARLVRGRATVKLDRRFAAVVRRDRLHVFLTPEGECRGLCVRRKSTVGFEVRELQQGTSSLRFTYRVVALRKDVKAPRFARVRLPEKPKGADVLITTPESGVPKRGRRRLRRQAAPRRRARRR